MFFSRTHLAASFSVNDYTSLLQITKLYPLAQGIAGVMGYLDSLPPTLSTALVVVGGLYCAVLFLRLLQTVLGALRTFVGASNLRSYGSWAIVTGKTYFKFQQTNILEMH